MCGIFGAIGANIGNAPNVMKNVVTLGLLSQARGLDSTGIACVYNNRDGKSKRQDKATVSIHKAVGHATEFFLDGPGRTLLARGKSTRNLSAIVGHCRQATMGAVTLVNAHPYSVGPSGREGGLVGVHNGTVRAFASTFAKKEEMTDSLHLYEKIYEHGPEQALTMAGRDAAYALVWYDMRVNKLFMCRNEARPLFTLRTGGLMYFASEDRMLSHIAGGSERSSPGILAYLEPGVLYAFDTTSPRDFTKTRLNIVFEEPPPPRTLAVVPRVKVHPVSAARLPVTSLDKGPPLRAEFPSKWDVVLASTVFPGWRPGNMYPARIKNSDQQERSLYYRGARGLVDLAHNPAVQKLLSTGCLYTGVIPGPTDVVYWVNGTDAFISSEALKDDFIMSYYGLSKDSGYDEHFTRSSFMYMTHSAAHDYNKRTLDNMSE